MEFIINTENTDLAPEKMPEVYYSKDIDDFVILFSTGHEIHQFTQAYGAIRIEPAEHDDDYPRVVLE